MNSINTYCCARLIPLEEIDAYSVQNTWEMFETSARTIPFEEAKKKSIANNRLAKIVNESIPI